MIKKLLYVVKDNSKITKVIAKNVILNVIYALVILQTANHVLKTFYCMLN